MRMSVQPSDVAVEVSAARRGGGASHPLQNRAPVAIGPPEGVEPSVIYKLYRGAVGEVSGQRGRIWVEFPSLQLCWSGYDLPAREADRVSLLDVTRCATDPCAAVASAGGHEQQSTVAVFAPRAISSTAKGPSEPLPDQPSDAEVVRIVGEHPSLRGFGDALHQLVDSRNSEGLGGLEFIQKRLFQYLWKHQGDSRTELALYEAQAVLAFNLDPKDGVLYLRSRLGRVTDSEIGEWLAQMSTQMGGLDPTMLGNYFSRRDTMDIFRAFVRSLDFGGADLVAALRLLFDTFKPGGEGQVISRILDLFAEAYFVQWHRQRSQADPPRGAGAESANFNDSDSVMQIAVSLIMLNTGLHVASKKLTKAAAASAQMSVEEYIKMARAVVDEGQLPENLLRAWYEQVRDSEISLQPLPRVAFSKLPVQPDIEGWLTVVLSSRAQHRYWAVLALQRMYLFSDRSDVEPWDGINLQDKSVQPAGSDAASRASFAADLAGRPSCLSSLSQAACRGGSGPRQLVPEDALERSFEVRCATSGSGLMLLRLPKPRKRIALVAESRDLMDKWVTLITTGPY